MAFNLKGLLQDEEFLLGAGLLTAGSQGQSLGGALMPSLIQASKIKKAFAPTINKTKAAVDTTIDTSTGKSNLVFVTDKQIAENPERFIPEEKKGTNVNVNTKDPSEAPLKIRKQYLAESKPFQNRKSSRDQVLANTSKKFEDRTASDDFTLIYQVYKFFDQTSVVREAEFENLQNLGSVGERLKTIIPKWTKGTTLSKQKVKDLENAMNDSFPSFVKEQTEREKTYSNIFKSSNFDTDVYMQSFIPKETSVNELNTNDKKNTPRGMNRKAKTLSDEELIEAARKLGIL